jgi:cystathionine beta-lyase
VLHPSLPTSPGHAHWKALCDPQGTGELGKGAGLVSVMVAPQFGQAKVDAFCDALQALQAGLQLGRPHEPGRALQPGPDAHASGQAHIRPGTLGALFSRAGRLLADLIADLRQATEAALR